MERRNLINHLEDHLGPIETGWNRDENGTRTPYQVVRFGCGLEDGSITFATLGLSTTALPNPRSGKMIRHELIMTVPDTLSVSNVPGVLQKVANDALTANRPYLRGDFIGPRGPLFPGSLLEALYVTLPVSFPDSFAYFDDDCLGTIVLAWLIPITAGEAAYIDDYGWGAFEDRLDATDTDLIDITRAEIDLSAPMSRQEGAQDIAQTSICPRCNAALGKG